MFPPLKRARARAGLVSWLWEQLQRTLAARPVTLADADAVRALEASVFAFDATLAERLGELYAGLGGLRGVLREKVRSIPEPPKADAVGVPPEAPRGDGRQEGPSAGAAIPVIGAPTVGTVASIDAGEAAAEEWRGGLATLAHHVRSVAPTSAWPYRLARVAAWLTLEAAPAAESGKTYVRAPKPSERADFTGMFEAGAWEGLRDAAEDALSEHIFWLDLHRWSALALERLGPPFAAARDAVGRETTALLARLPGLSSLYFANGTPFASPETADWLGSEGARWGGGGAPANRAAGAADDAATASLAAAEAKVMAGQVEEGLAEAVDLANHAAGAATRFRAQLQAAKLAHRAGKADLALALIDRLLPAVDATLEAWEPSVCGDFFETALRILRASSPESIDRQTLLFRRLLQVDPAAALRIG
jgi:type VI secretion system protein VasJ